MDRNAIVSRIAEELEETPKGKYRWEEFDSFWETGRKGFYQSKGVKGRPERINRGARIPKKRKNGKIVVEFTQASKNFYRTTEESFQNMNEAVRSAEGFLDQLQSKSASLSDDVEPKGHIILTGPPSAGKTSFLKKIENTRPVIEEAARDVIKRWNREDRWGKGQSLQEDIYQEALERVKKAPLGSMLDRTHLDGLAYGYVPKEPPEPIKDAEVWWFKGRRESYKTDAERKETFEQAQEIGERLKAVYKDLGYQVREIESWNPETWPKWIRKRLEKRVVTSSSRRARMNREAKELVKIAKSLVADTFECPDCGTKVLEKTGFCVKCKKKVKKAAAGTVESIKAAMGRATSFMNLGTELKKEKIKYSFSTSPFPIYMIKDGGDTYAVVNKKYAEDAEFTVGDMGMGKLGR